MTETRSVVVEREMPHPPEKLWRALTQPHLIEEWLMKNDFKPAVGHRFNLRGDWGGVLDCEVLAIAPNRELSYTWNHASERSGLQPPERGDVHADADGDRHHAAGRAIRLPAGSAAGLWRRQCGLAANAGQTGAGRGARLRDAVGRVSDSVTRHFHGDEGFGGLRFANPPYTKGVS